MVTSDGGGDGASRPEDGSEGRTGALWRIREWVVVDANRLLVAAGFSVAVFAALLGLHRVGVVAFVNDDTVTRMASGMVAGTFSLVTLVVSINQLILSREFTTADEFQERLAGVLEFRRDVETAAHTPVSPADPSGLFEVLLAALDRRAAALGTVVEGHDDESYRRLVQTYVQEVSGSTAAVAGELADAEYGTFEVLHAAIGYDDARQIHAARRLRQARGGDLPADVDAALEDVIDVLRLFKVAREHLKTRYLQHELTRFSQLTVYAGIPAVMAAALLGFVYGDVGGATLRNPLLPVLVSGLVAVVVLPLGLLGAYILRTAAIGHRTAAIAPSLPHATPAEEPYVELFAEDRDGE